MGSKKHKKESKKKKHRSRSRSPLDGEGHERKKHKKHKDRKKDRSPDVEEVPVDSHIAEQSNGGATERSRSGSADRERERDRRQREERHREREESNSVEAAAPRDRSPIAATSNAESLSVDETNRLRAKLGLKPLEVAEKPAEDGKFKDDLGEFYHKPASNIAQQKSADKMRERLQERKDKRKLEQSLQATKTLGEASDEEDASAWVRKSRDSQKQKLEAAKRAAMLDEMDAVFGVSALVAEDQHEERARSYTARQLKGLRVAHDFEALGSERDVVLTLADKEVLAEDGGDVLVNVNIVDDEKYQQNIIERKKAKAGYQAYDEDDYEAAALGLQKNVLSKYDNEIDTGRAARERGFVIGDDDGLEAYKFKQAMLRSRMTGDVDKRLESLQLPAMRIASDYLTEAEMEAKFKKTKRKGKMRKRAKQEPIDVDDYDPSAAPLETDDTEVKPEQLKQDEAADLEEEVEPDAELQIALARARRLRQTQARPEVTPKVEDILSQVKEEAPEESAAGAMVLDATAEFCRTLGDIPTYGQAGNREHQAEIMDFEREDMETEAAEAEAGGAWSRVDVGSEKPPDIAAGTSIALDAEPSLGAGVAGALQLALSKGYLERASAAPAPKSQHKALIAANHYSIEDKTHGEEDKHGRGRERGGYSGPVTDFREKSHFKPNIKLEYVDDDGRPLCPKEAFRYLSHKFHGKGPGKNKQEKRIKKAVQEGLMKKMSSTDTPLNTLAMLQEKQKETHSPYIVLSGMKKEQGN